MENLVDLHVHSCYSNGIYAPQDIIYMAKKKNIKTISITDCNSVLAYDNLNSDGIDVIPGIELIAKEDIGKIHILGYGIDPFDKTLLEQMRVLKENNIDFILTVIKRLKSMGISFFDKDISYLINSAKNIDVNDLAIMCVDYGYSESIDDAWCDYLSHAYEPTEEKYLTYQTCLSLIKEAGGISILANLASLGLSKDCLDNLVQKMVNDGLNGIEVINSKYTLKQIRDYLELVKKYNLLYSVSGDSFSDNDNKRLKLTGISVLNHLKRVSGL